jgi:putative peptidoglycan lipid II flippase
LLTIPSAVGLIVLGRPIIALIYERGKFTEVDTQHAAGALAFYAVGLAGYSAIKILAPAFYALDDARTPMLISIAMIAVNFVLNWSLVEMLEERGLALSTSTVALLNFGLLYVLMRRRIGGFEGRATAVTVLKILAASAVMGVVCWALDRAMGSVLGTSLGERTVHVAVGVGAGAGVFYVAASLLKVEELRTALGALVGRVLRGRRR